LVLVRAKTHTEHNGGHHDKPSTGNARGTAVYLRQTTKLDA
jgi:hypothetical protein